MEKRPASVAWMLDASSKACEALTQIQLVGGPETYAKSSEQGQGP